MITVASVLNWNGLEKTIRCIESLKANCDDSLIICVSDNNSEDFDESTIKSISKDIQVYRNVDNLGYAGGHMQAYQYALQQEADLFWMLNNDITLGRGTLPALVAAYEANGQGLYGSVGEADNGLPLDEEIWALEPTNPGKCSFTRIEKTKLANNSPIKVANLLGYSFMIPLSVTKDHGFLKTDFFLYFEETDYCLSLLKKGIPSYLVPESRVVHEGMGSSSQHGLLSRMLEYYLYRNLYRVLIRHAPILLILYYLRHLTGRVLKALFFKGNPDSGIWRYRLLGALHAFLGKKGRYYNPEKYV